MATLDDLLAVLPDNNTGEIDAADVRYIVTELWQQGASLDARIAELESSDLTPAVTASGLWQVNPQAGATPGGQQVTSETGDPSTSSWLRFSTTDQTNTDKRAVLLGCTDIYGQQQGDSSNWARVDVAGAATDHDTYVEIPVSFKSGGGVVGASQWQAAAFVFSVPIANQILER